MKYNYKIFNYYLKQIKFINHIVYSQLYSGPIELRCVLANVLLGPR